jgi:hypothetical protein
MKKLLVLAFVLICTNAFANPVNDTVNSITNWASDEKAKTIEFQKVKWQEGKDQLVKTKEMIWKLFGKLNVTQD